MPKDLTIRLFVAAWLSAAGGVHVQEPPSDRAATVPDEPPLDYAGGTLRIGAFFVSDLQTSMFNGTTSHPVGARVRLDRDLGVSDSVVAGRVGWEYRFNKRHGLDVEYYQLSVDGERRLASTITVRDRDFTVGVDVASSYEERIFKADYKFFFHDEGKVALNVSAGMHVSDFDLHVGTVGAVQQDEETRARAPLPVLGGRLLYRITPKLSMIVGTDVFLFKTDEAQGSLDDSRLLFEHRTFEHVYLGIGWTRFELNLDVEKEATKERSEWRSIYNGVYAYAAVRLRR